MEMTVARQLMEDNDRILAQIGASFLRRETTMLLVPSSPLLAYSSMSSSPSARSSMTSARSPSDRHTSFPVSVSLGLGSASPMPSSNTVSKATAYTKSTKSENFVKAMEPQQSRQAEGSSVKLRKKGIGASKSKSPTLSFNQPTMTQPKKILPPLDDSLFDDYLRLQPTVNEDSWIIQDLPSLSTMAVSPTRVAVFNSHQQLSSTMANISLTATEDSMESKPSLSSSQALSDTNKSYDVKQKNPLLYGDILTDSCHPTFLDELLDQSSLNHNQNDQDFSLSKLDIHTTIDRGEGDSLFFERFLNLTSSNEDTHEDNLYDHHTNPVDATAITNFLDELIIPAPMASISSISISPKKRFRSHLSVEDIGLDSLMLSHWDNHDDPVSQNSVIAPTARLPSSQSPEKRARHIIESRDYNNEPIDTLLPEDDPLELFVFLRETDDLPSPAHSVMTTKRLAPGAAQ